MEREERVTLSFMIIFFCQIIAVPFLIVINTIKQLGLHFWAHFSNSLLKYLSYDQQNKNMYGDVVCFRCTHEYGGKDCSIYYEQQNLCLDYCNQNGKCLLTANGSKLSSPVCSCYPGWTGPRCEGRISSACNGHCFNGGTCQDSPDPSLKPSCM